MIIRDNCILFSQIEQLGGPVQFCVYAIYISIQLRVELNMCSSRILGFIVFVSQKWHFPRNIEHQFYAYISALNMYINVSEFHSHHFLFTISFFLFLFYSIFIFLG